MKCTNCETEVEEGAAYCPMCGTELGKTVCGNCQVKISPDAKYCENCGATFVEGEGSKSKGHEEVTYTESNSSSGIGAMGFLGLLVLVGGIILALDAHQTMTEFQTTGGQVIRALSEQQQQRYESLSMRRIGGIVGAVVGVVMILADL